jgi:TPR repeat protein
MLSVPPNIKAQNSTSSQQSSEFLSTKQKAEQGDAEAQYELGKMYYNAKGIEKDKREAVK